MIEVYYLDTKSVAGTNVLIVAIFIILFVALFNTFASVSRLTWAFALDHGLPFSNTFAKVSHNCSSLLNYDANLIKDPSQV